MKRQQQNYKKSLLQQTMDPFGMNELIFEQKLFLPIILPSHTQAIIFPLIFKLMKQRNSQSIIIYVLSDYDLYFLYKIQLSLQTILGISNQYKLFFKKIQDFVDFISTSFQEIQNQQKIAQVQIPQQDQLLLQFKRSVGGKYHTVIRLQGKKQSEQFIRIQVAYRYGSTRQRIMKKQQKISNLKQLVRLKNPYLLKQFKNI